MSLASHIHLDPLGGIAGDMFVAAVLDAFPELQEPLLVLLSNLTMPIEVVVGVTEHVDHALRGKRFSVRPRQAAAFGDTRQDSVGGDDHDDHDHDHDHDHDPQAPGSVQAHSDRSVRPHPQPHGSCDRYARHGHVSHANIVEWLSGAAIDAGVRAHSLAIFRTLAEAEAAVHGVPADGVEFHEVGAWDSIADVVAASYLIDAIGATSWSVAPLPIGSGRIATAHGVLPVPAPATAWLTRGMAVFDDGIPGERVTPTGAAILRHLNAGTFPARTPTSALHLSVTGWGLGTRTLPDRANALRCLAFDTVKATTSASPSGVVNCIAFEVDDQSPEDLAFGLDRLRALPGVLQVMQIPAFGKKGRMAVKVEVVATVEATDDVTDHCFQETTTIGLRVTPAGRRVLPRTIVRPGRPELVAVKLVERGHSLTAKAEMEEIAAASSGHAEREQLRRRSEAEALLSGSTRQGEG
jgi:uncharacterized protein (TIGR00299 family) protein